MANTLNEYYKSQGAVLPSLQERQGVATKAGISNYTGTAEQNNSLLGYLKSTPTDGNVITGDNLTTEKKIEVPTPEVDTSFQGMNADANALLKTTKSQIATDTKEQDKQLADFTKLLTDSGNQGATNEQIIKDTGVDTLKKTLDTTNSEIEAIQKSAKDKIEAILGSGTLTKEQAQPQIDQINRRASADIADKSIFLSATSRQYDTASNIANRQITANSERIKAQIEAKKFVLEQLGTKLATEKANAFTLQLKQIDNEDKLLQDAIKTATDGLKGGSIDNAVGTKALQDLVSGKTSLSDFYKNIGQDSVGDTGNNIAGYDITTYATDPQHEQKVISIYNTIGDIKNEADATAQIKALSPNSPITGAMLMASAKKYGVDPKLMLAIMQQDSSLGTAGLGAKTKNAGNVGNDDAGNIKKFDTWNEGVDAVASWLKKHPATPDTSQDYIYGEFKSTLGEQELKAFDMLKNNDKSAIMQLVNGDILIADLVKSRGKEGTAEIKRLTQLAQKVDPTYSPAKEKIRYEYKKNWELDAVKGNVGTKNAINTALGHLADLSNSAKNLPAGTIQKMNSVKNVLNKDFGDPAVTDFRINLNALATELARVYKGGVPNEGEIEEWQKSLAENFSKKQFDGAFNKTSELLTSKITALRYGYKSAMGREYNQSLIDPDKRQALIDAGINIDSIAKEKVPVQSDPLLESFNQPDQTPVVPQATSTNFWGDLSKNIYGTNNKLY